jgi:hypothetical protein
MASASSVTSRIRGSAIAPLRAEKRGDPAAHPFGVDVKLHARQRLGRLTGHPGAEARAPAAPEIHARRQGKDAGAGVSEHRPVPAASPRPRDPGRAAHVAPPAVMDECQRRGPARSAGPTAGSAKRPGRGCPAPRGSGSARPDRPDRRAPARDPAFGVHHEIVRPAAPAPVRRARQQQQRAHARSPTRRPAGQRVRPGPDRIGSASTPAPAQHRQAARSPPPVSRISGLS